MQVEELRALRGAVLLHGPFGSGKTARLRALAGPALVGRASPDASEAFEAFRSALLSADDELKRVLLRTAGAGGPFFHPLAPELFPERRFEPPEAWLEAAAHWLARTGEECPGLVLALDDAHWLDEPSRQLVQALVPRMEGSDMLLLLTAETDEPALGAFQRVALAPPEGPAPGLPELDPETLERLRDTALLGTYFSPDGLDRAQALIEPVGDGRYRFRHPAWRNALVQGLDPDDRRERHRRLAERGSLFMRARHARAGWRSGPRVYQACLAAGLHSLEQGGAETAREFLVVARKADPEAVDQAFYGALGEACARAGRAEEARDAYQAALERASSVPERTQLTLKLLQLGLPERERRELLRQALEANGLKPPVGSPARLVGSLWRLLQPAPEPQARPQVELMGLAALWAASDVTPGPLLEAGLEAWRLSRSLGPSREKVRLTCDLMLISGLLGWNRPARHFGRLALQAARTLGDPPTLARTLVMKAVASHFLGHPLEAERKLTRHLQEQGHWLTTRDFLFACNDLCWNLMLRGQTRQALQFVERARQRVRPSPGSQADLDTLSSYVVSLSSTLGQVREALEALTSIQERFRNAPPLLQASLYGHAVRFYLEQGELGEPLEELLTSFSALALPPAWVPVHRRYFYISQAQARLAQCELDERGPSREALARFKSALEQLRRAARPPILQAHLRVLEAGWSRLNGYHELALRQLEQAERLADRLDAPEINFWAARERALINRTQGNKGASLRYAEMAHWLAGMQGWPNRARRIRREFSLGAVDARALSTASLKAERSRSDRLMQAMQQFREVHQMATTDSLTGIANRRHFFEQAQRLWEANDKPLAAVLLDVDHFKQINDTYGHAEGDQVLKAVAATCAGCLRQGDLLGRYGGEEFAILLSGVREEEARASAERVRAALEAARVGTLQVTASLGVALRSEEEQLEDLLKRADEALYRAKAGGRNRVEVWS